MKLDNPTVCDFPLYTHRLQTFTVKGSSGTFLLYAKKKPHKRIQANRHKS